MEELKKLIENGIVKMWEKYGKRRAYVQLDKVLDLEYNDIPVRNYFNRYERQNLSMYADLNNGGWYVSNGSEEARNAIIATVQGLM